MKKKKITNRIRLLIGLMAISVLGVLGLQAYWISNAIDLREQQFDKQVQLALNRTNIEIEDMETMAMFASFSGDSDMLVPPSQRLLLQNEEDSIEAIVYTGSADDGTVTVIIDTVSKDGATFHQRMEIKSSGSTEEDVSFEFNHTQELVWMEQKDVQAKYEQIGGVMDRVFVELMREPRSLHQRLEEIPVQELISHNLHAHGVMLDFEFAVINPLNEKVMASEDFNVAEEMYYQAALFPGDLFSEQGLLLVDFPARTSYVLQSLWGVILLSLIFTGIVIFAFWRMLNMLFSQKRLSEIKSDFINNMTHEFKTPIATITLAADSIQNPGVMKDPERIRHYVGLIKEENKRMNKQVERILQMSLLEKEDLQVKNEPVDLNDLVHEACNHFKLKVMSKGGQLRCQVPEDKIVLQVDRLHLFQCISNLIDNGIKYSADKPEIDVRLENHGSEVCISVEDKGIGISKDQQERIFEKFYRVPTGDVHDVKGHGLGLNYVKRIMQKMGGSVELNARSGKGSRFTLVFETNGR
jgi:signal transduction histidine kinase